MQFFVIVAVVVAVAMLLRGSDRVVLPEKLPLYVGLAIVALFVVWLLVTRGR